MSFQYQVILYDTAGAQIAVFDKWRTMNIEHQVNHASTLTLSMDGRDPRTELFGVDYFVEVKRRDRAVNIDWYTEFYGFHRTPQHQLTSGGHYIYTSYSRGLIDLLDRRSIRYPAGHAGSNKSGAAQDVIYAFVNQNAGPAALTSNGRKTDGVTQGLSVAASLGLGSTWSGGKAWNNLLSTIREIGEASSVDFDVVKLTNTTFEFRMYYPQLGTDRSEGAVGVAPVIFSPEFGNMVDPSHTIPRTDEVTSVLVLGEGEGLARATAHRTSAAINDSPWNRIELDRDARNVSTVSSYNSVGDELLSEHAARDQFSFQTIQTPSSVYGRDYFLGDIATGAFRTLRADVKIERVSINVRDGREEIKVGIESI